MHLSAPSDSSSVSSPVAIFTSGGPPRYTDLSDVARAQLQLHALGVQLSVDDFGVGYSSQWLRERCKPGH